MLYDNNFFVISAADFEIKNFSNVPAGKNPVVLTFDDGRPDQFRIIKNGDELCIDPECAVGIMESFFQSHPDFGKGGLFFITFNIPPFMQEEYVKMKLNMLLDMGYEIGNHTCNHYFMDRISYEKAYFEIHNFDIELRKHIGNKVSEVVFFAYPFGNIPVNQAITSIIRNKFKLAFGVNTIAANVEKTLTKNRFNVDRIDARPEKVMKYAIKPVLQK